MQVNNSTNTLVHIYMNDNAIIYVYIYIFTTCVYIYIYNIYIYIYIYVYVGREVVHHTTSKTTSSTKQPQSEDVCPACSALDTRYLRFCSYGSSRFNTAVTTRQAASCS